jgi:hypothetical protein
MAVLPEHDKSWYEERLAILEDRVRVRLGELSSHLGDADWLDDAFSAGDLLMVTVLRRLNGSGLLEDYPNVCAYIACGEARPAYKRAFDADGFHWPATGETIGALESTRGTSIHPAIIPLSSCAAGRGFDYVFSSRHASLRIMHVNNTPEVDSQCTAVCCGF